jgi:hypothetical protein
MCISAKSLRFDDVHMWVELSDGRTLRIPLAYENSRKGLHWDELDEYISIEGLLAGRGDETRQTPVAAQ